MALKGKMELKSFRKNEGRREREEDGGGGVRKMEQKQGAWEKPP